MKKIGLYIIVVASVFIFIFLINNSSSKNYNIEDYYKIDKQFVDNFYDYSTGSINYDEIKLNYDAYSLLDISMNIEIKNINLDKLIDIRPLMEGHLEKLIADGYSDMVDSLKTNQDYFDFMEKQIIPDDQYYSIINRHPKLKAYPVGELTYSVYHSLTKPEVSWDSTFTPEEKQYFIEKKITIDDGVFLLHAFKTVDNIKKMSDVELEQILVDEYLYKQKMCKKYLALYAINKIYDSTD
ncbi:hypothetical protein SH1V18_25960 [Vallitalea longa]|uniref:Uncharacterized protein n=1 Tax=Vallitalea longa TaxID=2936439 RepID=A0A9W5YCN2_9FIRM|nr:hypothetical protein [Vallitalea longa]GKX30116.1 hypothetical protein SH1V18_25960 [Vallitalea longa]